MSEPVVAYLALLRDNTLVAFRVDQATADAIATDWRAGVVTGAYSACDEVGAPFLLFLRFSEIVVISGHRLILQFTNRDQVFTGRDLIERAQKKRVNFQEPPT